MAFLERRNRHMPLARCLTFLLDSHTSWRTANLAIAVRLRLSCEGKPRVRLTAQPSSQAYPGELVASGPQTRNPGRDRTPWHPSARAPARGEAPGFATGHRFVY